MAKAKKKKLLNTEFLLLCDHAFTTSDGKLSLIGKFENIFAREFPAIHAKMFLVGHFRGENNSTHNVRLSISGPGGNEVLPQKKLELGIRLSGMGTGNLLNEFINLPLKQPGNYMISLWEEGEKIGETNFSVSKTPKRGGDGQKGSLGNGLSN